MKNAQGLPGRGRWAKLTRMLATGCVVRLVVAPDVGLEDSSA
jgi:hypothetical protein